ncbi:MAG: hypothetical protein M5R41_11890 [Bacteroidia bacterium]|nr:hypothetical protein [Bacteroidia bacterium]
MALPYTAAVFLLRQFLGDVNAENYLLYRQIGLLCILATILYLSLGISRTKDEAYNRYLYFGICYLVCSSFALYQEQLFRYYSFYVLAAFVIFGTLYVDHVRGVYKRKKVLLLLLTAPFLHMFLFWQLAVFFILTELSRAPRKQRSLLILSTVVLATPLLLYWGDIMGALLPMLASDMHATGMQMRGFSLSLLIKPVYAVFQFFFGTELTPTENGFVISVFALLLLFLLWKLLQIWRENRAMFVFLCTAGFIPFFGMYLFLEPLTLPGSTQFESKHAIFALPYFLLLLSWSPPSVSRWRRYIVYLPLLPVLYGLFFDFNVARADWPAIAEEGRRAVAHGGVIVLDGRADKTFRFYLGEDGESARILSLDEFAYGGADLNLPGELFLVLNDWKSYQALSMEQNWNSGVASTGKLHALSAGLEVLRQHGYRSVWSSGVYPTYAYRYEKRITGENPGFIPRPPEIMYRDLVFPIHHKGLTLPGFTPLRIGDSLRLDTGASSREIFFMLRCGQDLPPGTVIGFVSVDGEERELRLGAMSGNSFADRFSRGLQNSERWYTWSKRPVVTGSLAYPGSLWPAVGHVYRLSLAGKDIILCVTQPDVHMNIFQTLYR